IRYGSPRIVLFVKCCPFARYGRRESVYLRDQSRGIVLIMGLVLYVHFQLAYAVVNIIVQCRARVLVLQVVEPVGVRVVVGVLHGGKLVGARSVMVGETVHVIRAVGIRVAVTLQGQDVAIGVIANTGYSVVAIGVLGERRRVTEYRGLARVQIHKLLFLEVRLSVPGLCEPVVLVVQVAVGIHI